MAQLTINSLTSTTGVTVYTVLNSNISTYGASSFNTTALTKNGGRSMFVFDIDGTLLGGGTVSQVKITYKAYGSRTGVLGAKASARTGYIEGSSYIEVNSHGDVGRGSGNATSYTDYINNPYTNEEGSLLLFFKCINNISTQTNTVYVSNISIDVTYTPATYTVTGEASPKEGGTIKGGGAVTGGSTVELTAVPNAGYKFDKWSYGDSTENPITIVRVFSNITYTAYFEKLKLPPEFTSVELRYLDKQITSTNKVTCGEGYIISVGVK